MKSVRFDRLRQIYGTKRPHISLNHGKCAVDFFKKMWQAEMEAYAVFGSRRSMVTHRKLATATLMRSPGR